MAVNVSVKLVGSFRELSGRSRVRVRLERSTTLRELIHKLTEHPLSEFKESVVDPLLNDPRPNALILVNGKEISVLDGLETVIDDGDEVVFVPVMHGG